ncbi:MAG: response regulator [Bacteroidales bacterium]|jgi:DNA-binding response OmpR family regulator
MKKKILIIDDDKDLTRSYQVMIENSGFDVITAQNSKEGFEKLENEKPDLLILDVMMNSNLEGYNLLHIIKINDKFRELPVIMLTGMIDSLGVNLKSGVEDDEMFPKVVFRDKPISPTELISLIHSLTE